MTRRAWFYLMPDTGRGGEFPFIYYDFPKRFRKEDDRPRYSCELPPDVVEIASSQGLSAVVDWYRMARELGQLPAPVKPGKAQVAEP